MILSRSMGMSMHHERDYQQERAELRQSFSEYVQKEDQLCDSIMENPDLTDEQKKAGLLYVRQDVIQQGSQYYGELGQSYGDETQHIAEAYGVSESEAAGILYAQDQRNIENDTNSYSSFTNAASNSPGMSEDAQGIDEDGGVTQELSNEAGGESMDF